MTAVTNLTLRDEIRDYWSDRAETFDAAPGHGIHSAAERAAWLDLFRRHCGGGGGEALDLACGTGEMSGLLIDLGYRVTALDWSEPMLEIAREKAASFGRQVTFRQADAEATMEPDAQYDLLLTRHLVWTLVDPAAAFAEWHRILRPGGRLVLVDGDFVNRGWGVRMLDWLAPRASRRGLDFDDGLMARHRSILERVHFRTGARAQDVARMLREAGFSGVTIDYGLRRINRAIGRETGLLDGLRRDVQHRYVISAVKG